MTWKIYQDRNAWLANVASDEAKNQSEARLVAERLGANHISNGMTTLHRVLAASPDKWFKV